MISKKILQSTFAHCALVFLGFSLFYTLFFSPVLFSSRLLAQPADGIAYFLPAFYAPRDLWTETVFAGYPITSDPQNMTWYPPSMLLSGIPYSWNIFIVLAYVLASSFTYCYVYIVTSSRLAATASGFVYGLSGFMVAYLPMAAMIHAAAWIPLIVSALEKLRYRFERMWFVLGVIALACCFLGGHPQISVYGIGIGFFYALFLGWSAPIGRWKYYRWSAILFALGIGLCAIQLLPTIELSRLSVRADITYEVFFSGSLPIWQSVQFIFPYLFDSPLARSPFDSLYWGMWDPLTTAVYVGLLPLLLAAIGSVVYRKRSIVRFWVVLAVITLCLTFGEDLLLGRLLYHIPIYNLFRVQARHSLEFAFAVSVLAGFGIVSVQQNMASIRLIRKVIIGGAVLIIISLIGMNIAYFGANILHSGFRERSELFGISQLSFSPWHNPALGIPCVVFILGTISLLIWTRWVNVRWTYLVLILVLVLDLSSFGLWFRDWARIPMLAPDAQKLEESPILASYRSLLQDEQQRLLPAQGMSISWSPDTNIYPNLTRLWNVPSAGGYSPLILSRFSEMMKMDYTGILNHIPVYRNERQLDLMAVRYLLTAPDDMPPPEGLVWADTDLNISLGSGVCAPTTESANYTLDLSNYPYQATAIAITSFLGCSVEIPNDAELLEVRVVDADGTIETHSLLAGHDTSEYAYDCPDVQPFIQHQRATVFKSTPIARPDGKACQAHSYVSKIQLSRPQQIRRIELNWGNLPALINIGHVSLISDSEATSLPITLIGTSPKWKKIEALEGEIVYENQDVLPRAWLVPKTLSLQPEEVLAAVHTSQLPDGQIFDPKMMALVEDSAATLQSSALQPTDYANVLNITETQVELETQTTAPAFLVLSDVFYPGWKATIDGQPTPIFQTNYIQRGVKVPPGKHIVRFEFHPLSFSLGSGITVATLFGCGYGLLRRQTISAKSSS